MTERRSFSLWGLLALGLVGLGLLIRHLQALPGGPQPIVWDQEACAECHMHVGEPRFAAQLQTRDGAVLNFDDPGCLLRFQRERHPQLHAIYFHHVSEDRWLAQGEVAFQPVAATPMGHNLGAVDRGTPGALSYEEATARVARSVDKAGAP